MCPSSLQARESVFVSSFMYTLSHCQVVFSPKGKVECELYPSELSDVDNVSSTVEASALVTLKMNWRSTVSIFVAPGPVLLGFVDGSYSFLVSFVFSYKINHYPFLRRLNQPFQTCDHRANVSDRYHQLTRVSHRVAAAAVG